MTKKKKRVAYGLISAQSVLMASWIPILSEVEFQLTSALPGASYQVSFQYVTAPTVSYDSAHLQAASISLALRGGRGRAHSAHHFA